MPSCPLCPGRSFKDADAVRMHQESKHYAFECRYCDREFTTDNGRLAHEKAKHAPAFECEYCDREFATDEGRLAHQKAKHAMFECHYCYREFNSEEAREQHENAKHRIECRHCDREFDSEEAREQHENAKHRIECRHCDREFTTERGRDTHEEAMHPTFQCEFCEREFSSEDARRQHEHALHRGRFASFSRSFATQDALSQYKEDKNHSFTPPAIGVTHVKAPQEHEKPMPQIQCGYCSSKFFTQDAKNEHERSCGRTPANRDQHPALASSDRPSLQLGVLSLDKRASTDIVEEPFMTPAVTPSADKGSASTTSPSRSSDSTLDEGELFHSTSGILSTGTTSEVATIEQPSTCTCAPEDGTCSICRQASPSSDTAGPVPGDAGNLVSVDDQDGSAGHHDAVFQCTPCFMFFRTAEALRDHVCASRTAMFRTHCPICYSQFDDGASLQQHLDGLEFTCQLCLVRCCSEEVMQDHLLNHPTCDKCGKSFVDSLALGSHVESDHPVVVCWDCDGIVIEKNSLELHYTDSPAHPSCGFCGLGTKDPTEMDEHVKRVHATHAEIEDPEGGDGDGGPSAGPPLAEERTPNVRREDASPQLSEGLDCAPLPPIVETAGSFGGPSDESRNMESTLPSLSQPLTLSRADHVNEAPENTCITNEEGVDVRQHAPPSPTPSEHGSGTSRLQLHVSQVTDSAPNNDSEPSSLASSVSSELFSDASHSIVFVSADGIPEYVRENRAILVATSAGSGSSLSSARASLQLSSSSSLESQVERADAAAPNTSRTTGDATQHRLHCRICLRDPCEDVTATMCGHVFCKRCITEAVIAKSECPVCRSATLLYCLFKLDLSV